MRIRILLPILLLFALAGAAVAQESKFQAEIRHEGEKLKSSCGDIKSFAGCAEVLFTGQPFHIAAGSLAPQNGVGLGLAFVEHWNLEDKPWRLSLNSDAVASFNGSWRAGAYLKAVYVPEKKIVMRPGGTAAPKPKLELTEYPVLNLYAQSISLNKIAYFGLGQSTTVADRSYFGMTETIVGTSALLPVVGHRLNLSLYGEANGRFIDIRASHGQPSPSIEQVYTEATAPGLTSQPAFAQFGQGIRLRPNLSDYLRLNYLISVQEFIAAGDSRFSFRRFTIDLNHQIPLYKTTRRPWPQDHNGPNDCSSSATDSKHECETIKESISRNREGSIGARLFISQSFTSSGSVVPFYFQPTLGGGDLNGHQSLQSYQDYRFRAPNVLLLQGSFEHSIRGPLGFSFIAEVGKAALTRQDLDFSHLAHSYATGLTLRAGGFPMVSLMFAWGSHEGNRTIAQMNPSLLGGSARPSLY